jgi:hypothetical protein
MRCWQRYGTTIVCLKMNKNFRKTGKSFTNPRATELSEKPFQKDELHYAIGPIRNTWVKLKCRERRF